MHKPSFDPDSQTDQKPSSQSIRAGKNATLVGRDYTNTTNFNFTIWLVGVLALGGLAWAIYTGRISSPTNTAPAQPQSSPPSQTLLPPANRLSQPVALRGE